MASLKDMRVRIAATKATQKITKAMQMVAASKLRRAQAAAEAARPYAEHMDTVLRNIAASVTGLDSAPALLRGTGRANVHLLLVCTAERGLCGPFNSVIVRLVREHANRLVAEGKEVKIFCVGKKGYEQLRRQYEKNIIEHIELRSVRTIGFVNAETIARQVIELYEKGAFDVCTLFFSRFRSVMAQIRWTPSTHTRADTGRTPWRKAFAAISLAPRCRSSRCSGSGTRAAMTAPIWWRRAARAGASSITRTGSPSSTGSRGSGSRGT